MGQVVQIAGSLLVLSGFVLAQRGVLDTASRRYLVLNLVGAAALAVDAAIEQQWGFLLLEGVWAIVSAASLLRQRRRTSAADTQSSRASPFHDQQS